MASFSRKGWIIRTALRDGREFFEHFDENIPRSERRSETEMRALIEKRLNYFRLSNPDPKDQAQDGELVWTFKELDIFGSFTGSQVTFLAPTINAIRRTRQQDAERRRLARKAMKERSVIRQAMISNRQEMETRELIVHVSLMLARQHIVDAMIYEDGQPCPKFGLLSQNAAQIQAFHYRAATINNGGLKSFDDGQSIFVSDDLIKTVNPLESKFDKGWIKLLPLILLQEMRILMKHSTRLKTFASGSVIPEDIAQIAGETSAYSKLRMGFPDLSWEPCIEQDIAASDLSDEALKRYSVMAEENIAHEILDACNSVSPITAAEGPSKAVLFAALRGMGMRPTLCTHIACRDSNLAELAKAEQQSPDIKRATGRTKRTAPTPSQGDQPRQSRRL